MPLLHPRTATLLELLKINEKLQFAINILKHHDPIRALENPELWLELFEGTPSSTLLASRKVEEEKEEEGEDEEEEEQMMGKKKKKIKKAREAERGQDSSSLSSQDLMKKNKKEETADSSVSGETSLSAAALALSLEEQEKLKEFVLTHAAGNSTWLTKYAVQLQQKVNEISDKTKAEKP